MKLLQQTLLLFAVAVLVYALYKRLLTILSPARKMPAYPSIKEIPVINDGRLTVTLTCPKSYSIQGSILNPDGSLANSMEIITLSETEIQLTAEVTPWLHQPFSMEITGEGFRYVKNF